MDSWTHPRMATGTLPQYPHAHQDSLVSAARRGMASVAAAVLGDGLDSSTRIGPATGVSFSY